MLGKPLTEIILNGVATTVYFNDGDTFKILDGDYEGERVRVTGLNALESYGPVHIIMNNSPAELYSIAQKATKMAQKGPWTCKLAKGGDSYGRLLASCDDMAKALLESGLAHVYSVDGKAAKKSYINQQKTAQKNLVGMWKHGAPEYIITSLHSADEMQAPYNRLISTVDGHTKKMFHQDTYTTCQRVCIEQDNSCMVHVPYTERYGATKPDCLQYDMSASNQ